MKASLVLLLLAAVVVNAYHVEINMPDAQTYLEQRMDENDFKYGYQVANVNDQFQHKQKGPDDVTYGCYGHTDPDGQKQLTFFVADRLGYRTIGVDQAITVYPTTGSGSTLLQWRDLPFPEECQTAKGSSSIGGGLKRFDGGPDTAESRDVLLQAPLDNSQGHTGKDVYQGPLDGEANESAFNGVVIEPPASEVDQRSKAKSSSIGAGLKDFEAGPDTAESRDVLQHMPSVNSQGQTGNDADQGPADGEANESSLNGAAIEPPANDVEQQSKANSWQRFYGDTGNDAFILRSQCDQSLTLYVPFRVGCSDLESFETELRQLTAKYSPTAC